MSVTAARASEASLASTSPTIADDSSHSAVSWAAIFVGAAAAAALTLLLVILGFGLGLSSISPWSGAGATAGTIGIATVLWIAFTQFAASGVGGYLAGRLRVKWSSLHTDEVYFRDTAHGFMAWAVATLVVAAFLGSTLAGILDAGAKAGASVVGGATSAVATAAGTAASSADDASGLGYFTDRLYRKSSASSATPSAPATTGGSSNHAEAARIFATSLKNGQLSDDDRAYLASVVSQETGVPQEEATARVNDAFAKAKKAADDAAAAAKQAAETARKAAAHGALWSFVALLIGAFIASFSATIGGRRRDLHN